MSQKCPLKLDAPTLKGMNKLVRELKKVCLCQQVGRSSVMCTYAFSLSLLSPLPPTQHPFLQPIIVIDYLAAHQQLVIVQPFREGGSLKDTIYRVCTSIQ